MNAYKVGDWVRILNCDCGQPESMVGKILPIIRVDRDGCVYIKDPEGSEIGWCFIPSRVKPMWIFNTDTQNIHKQAHYQGKFVMSDGTSGIVNVHIYRNVTEVTIIVDPQAQYKACNKNKQFFHGIAFCNPCDKFDINTGVKEACKKALSPIQIDWDDWRYDLFGYQRSIYSAIRKTMRGTLKE